jgi:hypothetical protein
VDPSWWNQGSYEHFTQVAANPGRESKMAAAVSETLLPTLTTRQSILVRMTPYLAVLIAYCAATTLTNAQFMGDTVDYVESILTGTQFWDFGHLLWRPAGLVLHRLIGLPGNDIAGGGDRVNAAFVLVAVNWVAGALSVAFMRAWLGRVCRNSRVAAYVTICFSLSHAFLNFTQTGSSYVPGLSLLLLGLLLLATSPSREGCSTAEEPEARQGSPKEDESVPRTGRATLSASRTAIFAGLALAGAVCLWFPYAFVVPGALASPFLLEGFNRQRRRRVLAAAMVLVAALVLAYSAVVVHLQLKNVADLRAWVTDSSHGIKTGGLARIGIGLPRSVVNVGNDGLMLKRYVVGDPLNPVGAGDLLRLSLWKLSLFYLCAGLVVLFLLRSEKTRRAVSLMALTLSPVLAFAYVFDGGAVERYLIAHPVLFLCVAMFLEGQTPRLIKAFIAGALVLVSAVNVGALATPVVKREQERVASRIESLLPVIQPGTRLITINQQDELVNFKRSFPFHQINSRLDFQVRPLIATGTIQVDTWRREFALQTLSTWARGDDVWVSRRVFADRPRPEWYWVEGDDERVSWSDLRSLFAGLEVSGQLGGEDGFVLLAPSGINKRALELLLNDEDSAQPRSGD